jgi:histidinol-phosphatase (PHP family)
MSLPVDAHLHTDMSPDAASPIDVYAALARERGVSEIVITDHLDFDPGDPAYGYCDFETRSRAVQEAAERWAGEPVLRLGVEITYERRLESTIREHLASHRYEYIIGSIHPSMRSAMRSAEDALRWCEGKTHREASAWYWDELMSAIRSGLFDTIGHLDFVKRYMFEALGPFEYEPHADLYEAAFGALVESGTALEVNTSGLRQSTSETYPSPRAVARFREMGGARIITGSDAHRVEQFGFGLVEGYRTIAAAGFREMARGRQRGADIVELSTELVTNLLGSR